MDRILVRSYLMQIATKIFMRLEVFHKDEDDSAAVSDYLQICGLASGIRDGKSLQKYVETNLAKIEAELKTGQAGPVSTCVVETAVTVTYYTIARGLRDGIELEQSRDSGSALLKVQERMSEAFETSVDLTAVDRILEDASLYFQF